jgi:hypothetical protein
MKVGGCIGGLFILLTILEVGLNAIQSKNHVQTSTYQYKYVPHPYFGYVFSNKNISSAINLDGFSGRDFPKIPNHDYFDVLVIGGSSAFKLLQHSSGFTSLIEKEWQSRENKRIRIFSTAVPGWEQPLPFISYAYFGRAFEGVLYIDQRSVEQDKHSSFSNLIFSSDSNFTWTKYFYRNLYLAKVEKTFIGELNLSKLLLNVLVNLIEPSSNKITRNSEGIGKEHERYWNNLKHLSGDNKQLILGFYNGKLIKEIYSIDQNPFEQNKNDLNAKDIILRLEENWGFKKINEK